MYQEELLQLDVCKSNAVLSQLGEDKQRVTAKDNANITWALLKEADSLKIPTKTAYSR